MIFREAVSFPEDERARPCLAAPELCSLAADLVILSDPATVEVAAAFKYEPPRAGRYSRAKTARRILGHGQRGQRRGAHPRVCRDQVDQERRL